MIAATVVSAGLVAAASDSGSNGFDTNTVTPGVAGFVAIFLVAAAIVLGVVLVLAANGAAARISSTVFVISSLLLFGISALYHRINWSPRGKRLLKRMDHANIFLLIAGSYTPITVLALPPGKSTLLLTLVWVGAGLGILFRIFWIGAPRWLYVPLYLLLGYASLAFIVDFYAANATMMTLILVGGLCYTVGAVIYALKKPNPFPGAFGFHEIFHSLTLAAFLCHWLAIYLVATHPPVF